MVWSDCVYLCGNIHKKAQDKSQDTSWAPLLHTKFLFPTKKYLWLHPTLAGSSFRWQFRIFSFWDLFTLDSQALEISWFDSSVFRSTWFLGKKTYQWLWGVWGNREITDGWMGRSVFLFCRGMDVWQMICVKISFLTFLWEKFGQVLSLCWQRMQSDVTSVSFNWKKA